jgi:hypothetical protein
LWTRKNLLVVKVAAETLVLQDSPNHTKDDTALLALAGAVALVGGKVGRVGAVLRQACSHEGLQLSGLAQTLDVSWRAAGLADGWEQTCFQATIIDMLARGQKGNKLQCKEGEKKD